MSEPTPPAGEQRATDRELLAAWAGGGPAAAGALTLLVGRYERTLRAVVARVLRASGHRVEDITQETWVLVMRHASGYRGGPNAEHWLRTIAIRRAFDELTAQRRTREHEVPTDNDQGSGPEPAAQPVDGIETFAPRAEIARAVAALPPQFRDAITLIYYQQLSTAQASTVAGISQDTVKSRIQRGRAQLAGPLAHLRPHLR